MFSKVFTLAALALTFTAQVHAHAAIAPVLGVGAAPKRSDVQRPSTARPCGRTNIASTIDTSTPVIAAADGTFTVTVTNFNGGRDGSRQVTMTVDATGAGNNFVAGTVTKNGQAAPASVGSEQVTAQLPAGTKCTGGTNGNRCVASFKTSGRFGNCVVIQQGGAAAAASTSATATNSTTGSKNTKGTKNVTGRAVAAAGSKNLASAGSSDSTTTDTTTTTTTDKSYDKNIRSAVQAKINELRAASSKTVGTRAPRALRELDLVLRELDEVEGHSENFLLGDDRV